MNLLTRVVVAAVVIAAVIAIVYFASQSVGFGQHVSEGQAVLLVTHDLQNSGTSTQVQITNVTPSDCAGCSGSWHILASVTYNSTSPCPTYAAYSFDYPKYGFVYRVENLYTSRCIVYGIERNSSYIIASAPVAIARSYGLNVSNVTSFVNRYGFGNVVVSASYASSMIANYTTYNDVWAVNYTAPGAANYVFVAITQTGGNLITAYTASR